MVTAGLDHVHWWALVIISIETLGCVTASLGNKQLLIFCFQNTRVQLHL
jgi:hypothetical protein